MIIILCNIFFVSFYIYDFDLPPGSSLLKILYFILSLLLISLFFFKKKKDLITKFNLSFFSLTLTLIIIEFFVYLKPEVLPNRISIWLGDRETDKGSKVTEVLNKNPFIKFKPNTKIKINHYRGDPNEFSYEWTTDKNGFKNTKEIANLKEYNIIAIGDSFVEGFGNKTENIFSSVLTKEGYPTYNLGVQGYAMTQAKGALKQFGLNLNSDVILCVYVRGTSHRQKLFVNDQLKEKNTYAGGIANQYKVDQNLEIRSQGKYFLSATWLYLSFVRNNIKNLINEEEMNFKNPIFNKYPEIHSGSKTRTFHIDQMELLAKDLIELKEIAEKNNSKFIFGYMENRDLNYYEKASGKKAHPTQFYEGNFLKKFSNENNIVYIDFGEAVRNYIDSLPEDFKVSDLPYLKVDGHLSIVGHKIIANNIIKTIKKLNLTSVR